MTFRRVAWLMLVSLLLAGGGRAQSIGIFFDPAGTLCSAQIGAFSAFDVYILGRLGGAAAGGITGVEFRMTGFPSQIFSNFQSSGLGEGAPAISNLVWLGFPTCVTGTGGLVVLYHATCFTAVVLPTSSLQIEAASPGGNPAFHCPLVTLCDYPAFTKVCVTGGLAVINGSCTVPVQPSTWAKVKRLYD